MEIVLPFVLCLLAIWYIAFRYALKRISRTNDAHNEDYEYLLVVLEES